MALAKTLATVALVFFVGWVWFQVKKASRD
jgi:hypothetical protein